MGLIKEEYARYLLRKVAYGYFPEINPEKIAIDITRNKGYFMAVTGFILSQRWTLRIEKECFKMNEEAFMGLLAHEMVHMVQKKTLWSSLHITFMMESKRERLTDQEVINRGLGRHLLEFQKYHDKYYKKYNKSDGLTKKEIVGALKERSEL